MIDFPPNPTTGQIFSAAGATWKWDGTKWIYGGSSGSGGASITVSDTPPVNPTQGALWWNSAQGQLYLWYVDPNTAQWVAVTNQMGGAYLPLTGGIMSGPMSLSADPTLALQPVTLQYFNKYPMIGDNRLINGSMSVDQRNNGGSVALGPSVNYVIDRWNTWSSTAGKATAGRALSAASDLAATGFGYCFRYTSLAAYTIPATETYGFGQPIEADLISDFAFGTPGAKPVTLSFWVYSNPVVGTFSGVIQSYATPYRSYPFTFSVPVAQTWTKISVTIPGDTGGSAVWPVNGTAGAMYVIFDMGSGTSQRGPAGAWASATYNGATGAATVFSAPNNLFITGVKLEVGNVATPFNQQTLSKIMSDCQRYYTSISQALIAYLTTGPAGSVLGNSMFFPTRMRAVPTVGLGAPAYTNASALTVNAAMQDSIRLSMNVTAAGNAWAAAIPLQLNAEL
jgi:hypothetical protein